MKRPRPRIHGVFYYMKVSLNGYDKPLFATKCSNGYWISYEYGKFLKDKNGKLKVFSKPEIEEFHESYKLDFPLQYKQDIAKKEARENGNISPMFTARYDDPKAMEVLKSVFGAESLNSLGDNPNEELQQKLQNELDKRV